MVRSTSRLLPVGIAAALIAACGGGGSGGSSSAPLNQVAQTGNVSMVVSDASTEDWATIGVKVLSIALVPQGGGSNVSVYTAPAMAPTINLAQLDQIAKYWAMPACRSAPIPRLCLKSAQIPAMCC